MISVREDGSGEISVRSIVVASRGLAPPTAEDRVATPARIDRSDVVRVGAVDPHLEVKTNSFVLLRSQG